MKSTRRILLMFVAILFFAFHVMPLQAALDTGAISPQPSAQLKKTLPVLAKLDFAKTLAIAARYYQLAITKATPEEKGYIPFLINWKPDFSGKTANPAFAVQYSYPSAFMAGYTDLKGIYMALNAAVFTLDVKNAASAGNLASAIAAYGEDTVEKPLGTALKETESYANDAAVVYEYALALKLADPLLDFDAMPLLLNYGYLNIDRNKLDLAQPVFESAVQLAPDYLPAREGLAAYWLAAGDKQKAQKILEDARLPLLYQKMKQSGEDSGDAKAPQVALTDDLPAMAEKLQTLSAAPTLLATDFYEDLDPEGVAETRRFVANLASQWKYKAPSYNYLAQYSTLEAFLSGQGRSAFEAFQSVLKQFAQKAAAAGYQKQLQAMNNLGMNIDFGGVDINDVMNNPEKYKNLKKKPKVTGMEELKKRAQEMKEQLQGAKTGLQSGDVSGLLGIATTVAPEFAIFKMNPGDYANPNDIITQRYNMTILLRKIMGYKNYFFKQNQELRQAIMDDIQKVTRVSTELSQEMNAELAQLAQEHETSHDARTYFEDGTYYLMPQDQCDKCKIKKHAIHEKYLPQMNDLIRTTWMDATNFVNSRYRQQLQPTLDAFYPECMKNCMLISDPKIRQRKENEIRAEVYQAIFDSLSNVALAYSLAAKDYPYICDCDPAEIEAARERERQAFEEAEATKTMMENRARKEFEQGVIKENSQLYQRLDKYSAEFTLMFMHAKWHPLKTEVTYGVKVPLKGVEIGAFGKMVEEHIRNTTTYGGGITATASGNIGKLGVSGSVSLQGEMTTNGNGNVVRADVMGSMTGSASVGSYEATGTIQSSVMRGCKVSAEVTKLTANTLNPPHAVEAWNEYMETIGVFLPEKPKKVLWSGEYQVTK